MKAYVSCDNPWHWKNDWEKAGIKLPRLLASFAAKPDVKALKALCPDILIDSGAYSIMTGKADLKLEDYAAFVQKNQKLATFMNFDVPPDNEKSLANWNQLSKDFGVETVPVFQPNGGFSYLERYCRETDFVAVACHWPWKLQQPFFRKCFKIAKGTKLHLLGVSAPNVLNEFKPYSFDTSYLSKPIECGWFLYTKEGKIQRAHWTHCLHGLKRPDVAFLKSSTFWRRRLSWEALEEIGKKSEKWEQFKAKLQPLTVNEEQVKEAIGKIEANRKEMQVPERFKYHVTAPREAYHYVLQDDWIKTIKQLKRWEFDTKMVIEGNEAIVM